MPVLSNESVKVTPVTSRSTLTLEEIRDKMAQRPPLLAGFEGGWASTDNAQSNMGSVNVAPPASEPELLEERGGQPRMIRARYYYWTRVSTAVNQSVQGAPELRTLHGLDVLITEAGAGQISILVSTRDKTLLRRRDGAARAVEEILRTGDDTIRIDFSSSALKLKDTDIFLWLAVKKTEEPQIDTQIKLDLLTGISGTDASRRTADLRATVDFSRPNFLTAVAEADTLGPIEISFVRHNSDGRSSFQLRLHADGGFEINKRGISYPDFLSNDLLTITASYELAYELIPRINKLYDEDDTWEAKRIEVILAAMRSLRERYNLALEALEERMQASPGTEVDG